MTARLEATLQTVQTVRPALENFYASLSDEQKERFNELGPKPTAANAEAREAAQAVDSCKQPKPGLANLPIEKIEDVINPTDAQEAELNKLQDATSKAVEIMQAACPDETPLTPPGRLDAMASPPLPSSKVQRFGETHPHIDLSARHKPRHGHEEPRWLMVEELRGDCGKNALLVTRL